MAGFLVRGKPQNGMAGNNHIAHDLIDEAKLYIIRTNMDRKAGTGEGIRNHRRI